MAPQWNSPISPKRVAEVVAVAQLGASARVLDVGCGQGALLSQLGLNGHGLDVDADAIAIARRALPDQTFEVRDASLGLPKGFDLVACLGSSHAFGSGAAALPSALQALRTASIEAGWLLVGEVFRQAPIPDEYADFLGSTDFLSRSHAETVACIEAHGWSCEYAISASQAEWDAFEWAHFRRHRRSGWRDAWLRYGRTCMGFGLYLARAAADDATQGS